MKNTYKTTEEELVDIYLQADKEGKTLTEYLTGKYNDDNVIRYAKLFKEHKESILDRFTRIRDSITNVVNMSNEDRKLLSVNFANLYTDKQEEKIDIVYEIETNIENEKLANVLAQYLNRREDLIKGGDHYREVFKKSAEKYFEFMSELAEAKRTGKTKKVNLLISKADAAKSNIRYATGYANKDEQTKMTDFIDSKIQALMNKIASKPVIVKPKAVKIKK